MCSVLCLVGTSSGFATCLIDGALTQAHIKGMVRESMMLRKQLGHHSSTAVMFINHQGYSYVSGAWQEEFQDWLPQGQLEGGPCMAAC